MHYTVSFFLVQEIDRCIYAARMIVTKEAFAVENMTPLWSFNKSGGIVNLAVRFLLDKNFLSCLNGDVVDLRLQVFFFIPHFKNLKRFEHRSDVSLRCIISVLDSSGFCYCAEFHQFQSYLYCPYFCNPDRAFPNQRFIIFGINRKPSGEMTILPALDDVPNGEILQLVK